MKTLLTGIKPTGDFHLGNLLGMVKPTVSLQEEFNCFVFLADLHALTTNRNGPALRSQSYDIAAALLAMGFDSDRHALFRQSDIPLVTELAWYLSCVTPFGLLNKGHAFKSARESKKEVNVGIFSYPVLMAADILIYDADCVPVGKDQRQHIEFARDIAGAFNNAYGGEFLKMPNGFYPEKTAEILGTDGRKMSKSYGNIIQPFADEQVIRKQVMSIVTDSTPLEEPKKLDGTILGAICSAVMDESDYNSLSQDLAKGGMGWGHAKERLFRYIVDNYKKARKMFQEIRKDEAYLEEKLENGREKAYPVALSVLNRVREVVGVNKLT